MSVFTKASDTEVYETGLFLAAVAEVIRLQGFQKHTTAQNACALVIANRDEGHEFATEDFLTAGLAIGWLSEKEVLSPFEREVLNAVQDTELHIRQLNLVQYLIKMYNDIRNVKSGAHIGSIKERMTLQVEVLSSEYAESEWGASYRTKAVTDAGDVVLWYAKAPQHGNLTITGTVTKHTEFGGVKTTHLNRVKLA